MAQHTAKKHGMVKGVREAYDDPEMTEIEMEEHPTAKQIADHKRMMAESKKGGGAAMPHGSKPHGRTHHISVPKHIGKQFAVGHAVELEHTIRHYGKQKDAEEEA